MAWLQLVGSIKLQVSLAEYSLFYRALLQKRTVILSILLTVATLYMYLMGQVYVYVNKYICIHVYVYMYL